MTFFSWRTFRLLIIGAILVGNIWFFYRVMPSLGCFHLAGYNMPVGDTRFSLVSFINGECTNVFSLHGVTMGWPVIKELWPLVLLGAMIGYPIGELVRWNFSVEDLLEIAKEREGLMSIELFVRESKVKSMLNEAMARTAELPQLQEEVKKLRSELYETKYSAGEQKKSYDDVLRKAKSLENELVKARASIRRLKKKQPPVKWVDAEP